MSAADGPAIDRVPLHDLALAAGGLDRSAHLRSDAEALERLWREPATRVLVMDDAALLPADDAGHLALVPPVLAPEAAERHLLGIDVDGSAVFLARSPGASAPADAHWAGLREVGVGLNSLEAAVAVTAVALAHWHTAHRHCARCGEQTVPVLGGWVRRCAACGGEHYPRTDPAVIMLVRDDEDRALLGRNAAWPEGRFSTLAGFVEPGESLEAAVRREVAEETGVRVGDGPDDTAYLGSQPWPFPSSLMVGFHARAVSTDINVDGDEVREARWVSREELQAACTERRILLPPPLSISRRLIERWFGEPLPGEWS